MTGAPVGVAQLVGVAVVGGHEEDGTDRRRIVAADGLDGGHDPPEAGVDGLERPERRVHSAGVPDHVGVGVVRHDEVVVARARSR